MTERRWEEVYPALCSMIPVGAWVFYDTFYRITEPLPEKTGDMFGATVNIGVVVAGFLGTALTVLMSLQDSAAMVHLRDQGRDKDTVRYFLAAITYSIAFCAVSACGVILSFKGDDSLKNFQHFVLDIWGFFGSLCLLSTLRVLRIFRHILISKKPPSGNPFDSSVGR